jgi:signal peptidase I
MPTERSLLNRAGRTLLAWIGLGDAEAKMRANAENWLELADKVWHFRRDQLGAAERLDLVARRDALRQSYREHAHAGRLKLQIDELEGSLRRTGGPLYPKSALVENVEFFLVAAIVIIGIRTYFVQPFKIPTNSMWPTFYGMTPEVYRDKAAEPGPLAVAARAVAFGAWPHRLDAPRDGEVLIPVGGYERRGIVHCRIVPGHSWLVFPTQLREYTLLVGDQPVTVRVPLDFDFDWVVFDAFFPSAQGFTVKRLEAVLQAKVAAGEYVDRLVDGVILRCIRAGRQVRTGERLLAFDEMTGDQLFVDRMSYHFTQPKVGQGFVFSTARIPGIGVDQYYVKRLVGTPGDTIQIHAPVIYRNGQPITGAEAFELNARRSGNYRGYLNGDPANGAHFLLTDSESLTVPDRSFFAMGDNSGISADGRYWGFVPASEAVGRPLFVYFPFSRRWGPSR